MLYIPLKAYLVRKETEQCKYNKYKYHKGKIIKHKLIQKQITCII